MELLYVDNIILDRQCNDEFYYFVLNYIIGEKVSIHSNIGFYFYVLKNIDKLSTDELIKCFEIYNIYVCNINKIDVTKTLERIEFVKKNNKRYNEYKRFKILPKLEFKVVQLYNKILKGINEGICNSLKGHLIEVNLLQYIDLCNEGIVNLNYSFFDREGEVHDNGLGERIYNLLKTRKEMLVINELSKVFNEFNEFEKSEHKYEKKKAIYNHITFPLLTIPLSRNLSANDLIMLRKIFQLRFASLISKIQTFRKEINQLILNKKIKIKINEFTQTIETDLKSLQDEIDNNIYVMRIKNSDPEYTDVKIILGLTTNEFLIHLYSFKCVIPYYKVKELKDSLDPYIGDDLCEVYLSYEIDRKLTNKN